METARDYQKQAEDFLTKYGIKFSAKYQDTTCPPWEEGEDHIHGDRYRITLTKAGEDTHTNAGRVSFNFWNSRRDADQGIEPSAYDVLACISSDIYTPDTFGEFCAEYGYDQDSRRALASFKRADRFAVRLRRFFSEQERETLSEIR